MKVEKGEAYKGFEPFKFGITVENEEELKYLWLLFNMGANALTTAYRDNKDKHEMIRKVFASVSFKFPEEIFNLLDEELKKYQSIKN